MSRVEKCRRGLRGKEFSQLAIGLTSFKDFRSVLLEASPSRLCVFRLLSICTFICCTPGCASDHFFQLIPIIGAFVQRLTRIRVEAELFPVHLGTVVSPS